MQGPLQQRRLLLTHNLEIGALSCHRCIGHLMHGRLQQVLCFCMRCLIRRVYAHRLGIPDTDYSATVKMPSAEFQRIVKCAAPFRQPTSPAGMALEHLASY